MRDPVIAVGARARLLVVRPAGFAVLWVVLHEGELRGWGFALVAIVLGTALSHRLLPARGRAGFRPVGLVRLAGLFLTQSVSGGVDVARRAVDPRLPVRPGMVELDLEADDLSTRVGVAALVSLLPGTICVRAEHRMRVHSIDVGTDVTARVRAAERSVIRALGPQRQVDTTPR
jgi:multicomponent Na+:H+ antiporter subunit E